MRVKRRNLAHLFRLRQFACPGKSRATGGLNADLHHAMGAEECPPHAPRVIGIESHRLFLVNILARLNGRDKIERMLVLRRRDENSVETLVFEHPPKVAVLPGPGHVAFHLLQAARVDIRHGDTFRVWAAQSRSQNLSPTAPASDQPEANAVIGSQNAVCREEAGGGSRSRSLENRFHKLTSVGHQRSSFRFITRWNTSYKASGSSR